MSLNSMSLKNTSLRNLVAASIATAALAAAVPVSAADLGYGHPGGTAYEDPRYSDIYRHPAPPPPKYAAPYPPPPVYREERFAPPPHYSGPAPHYRQQQGHVQGDCLPKHVIQDRLQSRGWHDFHAPQIAGNFAHVRARRPSGRLFDLTVDRCSGEVLQVEPIDGRRAEAQPLPPAPPPWGYRDHRYGGY